MTNSNPGRKIRADARPTHRCPVCRKSFWVPTGRPAPECTGLFTPATGERIVHAPVRPLPLPEEPS